jgi:probable rRNA maturation factor
MGAPRPLEIAIRHPRLKVDRGSLSAAVEVLDAHARRFRGGCPPGALSLAFLTDAALARLHGRFLGDASPTDVITFPGDPALGSAGEVCVSVDAARRRTGAAAARLSREITLYVVHGWLHLAGYGDKAPAERRAMRLAEARALRLIAPGPRFKLA